MTPEATLLKKQLLERRAWARVAYIDYRLTGSPSAKVRLQSIRDECRALMTDFCHAIL